MARDRKWILAALLSIAVALGIVSMFVLGGGSERMTPTAFGEADLERVGTAEATGDGAQNEAASGNRTQMSPQRTELPAGQRGGESATRTPLRIEGRVVDRSGAPLEGAVVHISLRLSGAGGTQALRVRQPETTLADGRFAFAGTVSRPSAVTVDVRCAGHAPSISEIEVAAQGHLVDLGEIRLLVGGGIVGVVVDGNDRGLAGAAVALQPAGGNLLGQAADRATLLAPVICAASGSYRFANLMPGRYRVRASAAGMQNANAANVDVADGLEIRLDPIRLAAGVSLSGIVLSPGAAPFAGASVRAGNERTTSGSDGRFRLDHLPPTALAVEVRAAGYLTWQSSDVRQGAEVRVELVAGLRVTGTVVDGISGAAVERFAAQIRRSRALNETDQGWHGFADQLRQRIDSLRVASESTQGPQSRAHIDKFAADLQARMLTVARDADQQIRVPSDLGAPVERQGGRFWFTGLDEGVYVVDVLSEQHRFVRSAPFALRRDAPTAEVRIVATRGCVLRGVVIAGPSEAPVNEAQLELVKTLETGGALASSLAPRGSAVAAARSDQLGRFEFAHVVPGRYYVSVHHPHYAEACSAPLELNGDLDDLRIALVAPASLSGRVLGIPAGRERDARVLAIGGAATVRDVDVETDGTYRFESLDPGEYMLRTFLCRGPEALAVQMTAVFAARTSASKPTITLVGGQRAVLDLGMELPPTGSVRGRITIHGAPANTCRLELRAEGGPRPPSVVLDERGEFALTDLLAGEYSLRVTAGTDSRQELYREAVSLTPSAIVQVFAELRCGGLHGRVVASGGAPTEPIEGTLLVLPGATSVPSDLREYARRNRVHELRVRGGAFRADVLTAGPARLVVQIRGRQPTEASTEIPAGANREVTLSAGAVR